MNQADIDVEQGDLPGQQYLVGHWIREAEVVLGGTGARIGRYPKSPKKPFKRPESGEQLEVVVLCQSQGPLGPNGRKCEGRSVRRVCA